MGTLNFMYQELCKCHTLILDKIGELTLEKIKMTFGGITFDTLAMIMAVDHDKVTETLDYCRWAMGRQFLRYSPPALLAPASSTAWDSSCPRPPQGAQLDIACSTSSCLPLMIRQ